jgi:thiosulfate/3-mercaptopyruvate sulfurtransferase
MAIKTLIDTAALAAHLSDPSFVIVDCRYDLRDEAWGAAQYRRAHIPGAVFAHLGRDLAGEKSGRNGRHPLPDPETFARTLGRLGVDIHAQVIAYDQTDGSFASRLWWMVRWMGHDAAAVLDGGFARWLAEGRPTRSGDETRKGCRFVGSPRREMTIDVNEVKASLGSRGVLLVDARAPERYRGEVEPLDAVAGHIPGAVNYHFKRNVAGDGRLKSADELRRQLLGALGGIEPAEVVCYCGSGITACHNLLAFEQAGLGGARLYAGSWSEWSSDPTRPVEVSGPDGLARLGRTE